MTDLLNPTIYHEEWWLKAATNNSFDQITIFDGGRIVGRLPFEVVKIRGGRTMCRMPNLTHCLGPAIDDGNGSDSNKSIKRNSIIRRMIKDLPDTTGFYQKLHGKTRDVVAFQHAMFDASVEFTYEVAPGLQNDLWFNLRDKTRNVIRRASEQMEVTTEVSPEEFILFYNNNLTINGAVNYYDLSKSVKVCEEALHRRRGRFLAIRDNSRMLSAAIFYIWDADTAYYFMSTRTHKAHNGAISYLIWMAMLDASARKLIFDFDGLGTIGSNLFYIGFGGKAVPRYTVHRANMMHKAVEIIGNISKRFY